MTTILGNIFLLLTASLISCDAAPTTYDQRQDGKLNVLAQLENFLFFVDSSTSFDPSNLASQVLELPAALSRSSSKKERNDDEPSTVRYEANEAQEGSKEPYRVEIVRGGNDNAKSAKDGRDAVEITRKPEIRNAQTIPRDVAAAKVITEKPKDVVEVEESVERKGKNFWADIGAELMLENLKRESDRGWTSPLKNLQKIQNVRTKDALTDAVIDEEYIGGTNVANSIGRSGIFLKKELTKKDMDFFSESRERNDVGLIDDKPQELKLLGGGIENCGPGRYRDRAGVCQFDEAFN